MISLGSQYEYLKLYLRQRGEFTLIAEPVVITVNDRSIDDGGMAQLMVAYDIPSTSTNTLFNSGHVICFGFNVNEIFAG